MSKMTTESKAKLREIAQKRRKENPKAKDYEVADWLIGADWVKEHDHGLGCDPGPDYFNPKHRNSGRTLKYVPEEVIEALAGMVPTVRIRYRVGPGRARTTYVFPNNFIVHLLHELKLPLKTYTKDWSTKYIQRCILPNSMQKNPE